MDILVITQIIAIAGLALGLLGILIKLGEIMMLCQRALERNGVLEDFLSGRPARNWKRET